MSCRFKFLPSALKEMQALAPDISEQFKQELAEIAESPERTASQLHGFRNVFKIRLPVCEYCLVYSRDEANSLIHVIAVSNVRAVY